MIRQASHLMIGNLLSRCVFAFLTIVVAKLLSPDQYGAFSYAIATVTVASYFCELGLQSTYLREAAGGSADWHDYTVASFYLRLGLLVLVTMFMALVLPGSIASGQALRPVLIMFVPGVLGLSISSWITGGLLAKSDTGTLAKVRLKAAAIQALFVGIGMLVPTGSYSRIDALAVCYGLGLAVGGFFGIRNVPLSSYRISLQRFQSSVRRLFDGLYAYTFSGLLYMLAPTMGVLLLQHTASLAVVGTFALALRVPQFMYTIPGSVAQAFYPRLFQAAREKRWPEYSDLLRKEVTYLLVIGGILAVAVIVSEPLIVSLLGHARDSENQREFRRALIIGSGLIFVQSLSRPLGHALETTGKAMYRTTGQAVALAVSAVLFVTLGARFGVTGAMLAAVSGEVALYLLWFVLAASYVRQANVLRLSLPSLGALFLFLLIAGGAWHWIP